MNRSTYPSAADVDKAFSTIPECAFSGTAGRIYNDLGEGDSGIDAATLVCEHMAEDDEAAVGLHQTGVLCGSQA
jgi:hypothetical protein